jgi:hypothetical protein
MKKEVQYEMNQRYFLQQVSQIMFAYLLFFTAVLFVKSITIDGVEISSSEIVNANLVQQMTTSNNQSLSFSLWD